MTMFGRLCRGEVVVGAVKDIIARAGVVSTLDKVGQLFRLVMGRGRDGLIIGGVLISAANVLSKSEHVYIVRVGSV